MKKATLLPFLTATLLAAGACSSGKDESTIDATRATCQQVFGSAGVDWLKRRAGEDVFLDSDHNFKEARSLFYPLMRNWAPEDNDPSHHQYVSANMCLVGKETKKSRNTINIRYALSIVPFSEVSSSAKETKLPVSSDITLVYGKGHMGGLIYRVYFKCKIAGTPKGQEEGAPVMGEMTDNLTGDLGARSHLQSLLHSAQEMERALDCTNSPDIPTEPPASVK